MGRNKIEISFLLGWMLAGGLSQRDDWMMGLLSGLVAALMTWGMLVLYVLMSNYGFPHHRRAPVMACVVAPITTGLTLYLLRGWPSGSQKDL